MVISAEITAGIRIPTSGYQELIRISGIYKGGGKKIPQHKKSGMWFFLQSKPVFPKSSALFMPKPGLTLTPAPDDSTPEHSHPNISSVSHIQYLKFSPFLRIEAQSVS